MKVGFSFLCAVLLSFGGLHKAEAGVISLVDLEANVILFNVVFGPSFEGGVSNLLNVNYSETQTTAKATISPLFDLDTNQNLRVDVGAGNWDFSFVFNHQDLFDDDLLTVTGPKLQHVTGKTLNGLGVSGEFPHSGDDPTGTLESFIFNPVNAKGNDATVHRNFARTTSHSHVGHRDRYVADLTVTVDTGSDEITGFLFNMTATHAVPEPSTFLLLGFGLLGVAVCAARVRARG